MVIGFTKDFPYKIISWEETYVSATSNVDTSLTAKATGKNTAVDYSNKNVDVAMRKGLGLNQYLISTDS